MQLDAFRRQVQVFVSDLKSPAARSKRLADVAERGIADIRASNRSAGVGDTVPQVTVDGKKGAPLPSVQPDGVIVAEFNPVLHVLEWIGEQLIIESPRLTGKYQRSHVLEVDGVEHDPDGIIPVGKVYLFVNRQPYARKIEPRTHTTRRRDRTGRDKRKFVQTSRVGAGQSQQAPEGVYSAIAVTAATRFGNIARITYSVDNFDADTGYSHPAIIVRPF
ncbi:hypothetical protein [Aureimonas ureilytica]|uniref:hypothetical protein n=1 Tax=Aureimonas ureilytica TaxID=401562 RepID=UPI00036138B5|nr:hypothetical protein [Aureimonas ureilytica]